MSSFQELRECATMRSNSIRTQKLWLLNCNWKMEVRVFFCCALCLNGIKKWKVTKSAKTIGIVMHDDPFNYSRFFHSKAKAQKKVFSCTKAESTMIIENEVEIVQWLPLQLYFVCLFSMFWNARRRREAKDNKENIGLGWKARALLTSPLEKIFCCCRLLASIFYASSLLFCLMSEALVNAFQWVALVLEHYFLCSARKKQK